MHPEKSNHGFLDTNEKLPFEDLFSPLVVRARSRLSAQLDPSIYALLAQEAHAGWERYLLVRLTTAGAKAAHWQFQVSKTVRAAFPRAQTSSHAKPDFLYREFVGCEPSERLQKLFAEFPALAELCDLLEKNWISTLVEFSGGLRRIDTN